MAEKSQGLLSALDWWLGEQLFNFEQGQKRKAAERVLTEQGRAQEEQLVAPQSQPAPAEPYRGYSADLERVIAEARRSMGIGGVAAREESTHTIITTGKKYATDDLEVAMPGGGTFKQGDTEVQVNPHPDARLKWQSTRWQEPTTVDRVTMERAIGLTPADEGWGEVNFVQEKPGLLAYLFLGRRFDLPPIPREKMYGTTRGGRRVVTIHKPTDEERKTLNQHAKRLNIRQVTATEAKVLDNDVWNGR